MGVLLTVAWTFTLAGLAISVSIAVSESGDTDRECCDGGSPYGRGQKLWASAEIPFFVTVLSIVGVVAAILLLLAGR
jgi:hypothetical protein